MLFSLLKGSSCLRKESEHITMSNFKLIKGWVQKNGNEECNPKTVETAQRQLYPDDFKQQILPQKCTNIWTFWKTTVCFYKNIF